MIPQRWLPTIAGPVVARRFIPSPNQMLLDLRIGQWVKASRYSQAHRVATDTTIAVCGRPLEPELHEWVVAAESKDAHCRRCKGIDYSATSYFYESAE